MRNAPLRGPGCVHCILSPVIFSRAYLQRSKGLHQTLEMAWFSQETYQTGLEDLAGCRSNKVSDDRENDRRSVDKDVTAALHLTLAIA